MNEIEYRNRLIENIDVINELILKVQKKNKYFNIILVILIIIIIFLLLIICFYAYERHQNINKDTSKNHI